MLISSIPQGSKLFKAVLFFLALRGSMQFALAATLAALALFVFSVIIDALHELCSHVSEAWIGASPLERLIILVLAVLFARALSPIALKIWKRGI